MTDQMISESNIYCCSPDQCALRARTHKHTYNTDAVVAGPPAQEDAAGDRLFGEESQKEFSLPAGKFFAGKMEARGSVDGLESEGGRAQRTTRGAIEVLLPPRRPSRARPPVPLPHPNRPLTNLMVTGSNTRQDQDNDDSRLGQKTQAIKIDSDRWTTSYSRGKEAGPSTNLCYSVYLFMRIGSLALIRVFWTNAVRSTFDILHVLNTPPVTLVLLDSAYYKVSA